MNLTSLPYSNILFWVLCGVVVLMLAWNVIIELRIIKINKKLAAFFQGEKGEDLEGVLFEQIKRLRNQDKDIKELFQITKDLGQMATRSIQKAAVVRFNPFGDTGGNQSFAISLLDNEDNGIVISSLYSREGMRVYAKPVKKGKSKYQLSVEEQESIVTAQKTIL